MSSAEKKLVDISKFLCFVLRHKPESIGVVMDSEGWVDVNDLIKCCANYQFVFDHATLDQVVETDDKKRFTYSEDKSRIRAAQGHSIQRVVINFTAKQPPATLYHGTAVHNLPSIRRSGLLPGERKAVHLSEDAATALSVGKRYGVPAILRIDTKKAEADGIKFYISENGVWLTENVPAEYISFP